MYGMDKVLNGIRNTKESYKYFFFSKSKGKQIYKKVNNYSFINVLQGKKLSIQTTL